MSTSQGSDQASSGSSRYGRGRVGGGDQAPPPHGDTYGTESPPEVETHPGGYGQQPPTEPPTEPPSQPPTEDSYGPEDSTYGEPGTESPPPVKPPTSHPCPPSMTCDTQGIDTLACEATADKARHESYDKVAKALEDRRTAFDTARGEYMKARDQANRAKKKLERDIKALLDSFAEEDKTGCKKLNTDEIRCLDQAFQQVLDCLDDCPEDKGCCVDCSFEKETWTVGQIDDLRLRVEKAEECFDKVLVKEPEKLAKRVEDLKGWVTELQKAMDPEAADPQEEPNRLYARAKRLKWLVDTLWGRFSDATKYQECLCCGLRCSLKGRGWLAELAGEKAFAECQEAAKQRRCKWLRDNMVDETLATQLVLCPPGQGCGEKGETTQSGSDSQGDTQQQPTATSEQPA